MREPCAAVQGGEFDPGTLHASQNQNTPTWLVPGTDLANVSTKFTLFLGGHGLFGKLDADKDGFVTKAEPAALGKKSRSRCNRRASAG